MHKPMPFELPACIKGLLIDKDGTLIDLAGSWIQPVRACAEYLALVSGQPDKTTELLLAGGLDPKTNEWLTGSLIAFGSSEALLNCWQSILGKPITAHMRQRIDGIVAEALKNSQPIVPSLPSVLEQLSLRYTLGVASMDDARNVNTTLFALNIDHYFDFTCGADSGYAHKPSAEMVLAFAATSGLQAHEIAVVGDSPKDCLMATAAGSTAIGVLSGASDQKILEPVADFIIDDISFLLP